MSRHTSSLKLLGAIVGVLVLASQACAFGGPAPLLISRPDYQNDYVSSALAQDFPGGYGLTADGYPVVRDADGRWVYLACPCYGGVAVYDASVRPVASTAIVAAPQCVSSSRMVAPSVVIMPGPSNNAPAVAAPTVKAKVKTASPRPRPKARKKPEQQPKKIVIHGNRKPPTQPRPVAAPVPSQEIAPPKTKGGPSGSVYMPSPPPNSSGVGSPNPGVAQTPDDMPQMIVISPQ